MFTCIWQNYNILVLNTNIIVKDIVSNVGAFDFRGQIDILFGQINDTH